MKTGELYVPATEFKSKCLELMHQVHDRKRNGLIVTVRGKPLVKVVPIDEDANNFLGCMKGIARVHGDLTPPTDEDWEGLKD